MLKVLKEKQVRKLLKGKQITKGALETLDKITEHNIRQLGLRVESLRDDSTQSGCRITEDDVGLHFIRDKDIISSDDL